MVKVMKNERANMLKKAKSPRKDFSFTAGILKYSLTEGRMK